MAVKHISIERFLEDAETLPVLDVRSPAEYIKAHIPGAHSFPLFSDEERRVIGTVYKQVSRQEAIKIGLEYFGPKLRAMIESAERICRKMSPDNKVLVHCWRGGMRSSAIAWLLDFYGFEVHLLEGGYKAYRHWVIAHWSEERPFRILAGNTGSGKTEVLHALHKLGAPVLDLEGLAMHKGSAFGGLDKIPQPSQEMFENRLAAELHRLQLSFGDSPVWVEDESQRIGDVNIPIDFFRMLRAADKVFVSLPFSQRADRLVAEYGRYSTESIINAIVRIRKRLGPLETKTAIAFLIEGNVKACFEILLHYYDKHYYPNGLHNYNTFSAVEKDAEQMAAALYQQYL